MTIRWIVLMLSACGALVTAAPAADKLEVIATTPDLASIARAVGGDRVDVIALARPTEDPHFVDPKPSYIMRLEWRTAGSVFIHDYRYPRYVTSNAELTLAAELKPTGDGAAL